MVAPPPMTPLLLNHSAGAVHCYLFCTYEFDTFFYTYSIYDGTPLTGKGRGPGPCDSTSEKLAKTLQITKKTKKVPKKH